MAVELDVVCSRGVVGGCGFRVHDRYFETKTRFAPGVCPRCNGPVTVVLAGTDTPQKNLKIGKTGRVEPVV